MDNCEAALTRPAFGFSRGEPCGVRPLPRRRAPWGRAGARLHAGLQRSGRRSARQPVTVSERLGVDPCCRPDPAGAAMGASPPLQPTDPVPRARWRRQSRPGLPVGAEVVSPLTVRRSEVPEARGGRSGTPPLASGDGAKMAWGGGGGDKVGAVATGGWDSRGWR